MLRLIRSVILALIAALPLAVFAQDISGDDMRSLDGQVQEIKSDVLSIASELDNLEERLLYPSNTQVALFVALADGEAFRLDHGERPVFGRFTELGVRIAEEGLHHEPQPARHRRVPAEGGGVDPEAEVVESDVAVAGGDLFQAPEGAGRFSQHRLTCFGFFPRSGIGNSRRHLEPVECSRFWSSVFQIGSPFKI